MSSTPRDTPPPGRPSFSSPRQSDPQFAQFLQHACLPLGPLGPLGPLHASLSAMQAALGSQPAPAVAQAWQDVLAVCHRLEAQWGELDARLLESRRTLEGLLQLLNAEHASALEPSDQYLILQHLHHLLTRTLAALHPT
jgi:hypothetical protein